jgi:hypothetical protein
MTMPPLLGVQNQLLKLQEPKMGGGAGAGFEKWPSFPAQTPLNGCVIFVLGMEGNKREEAH